MTVKLLILILLTAVLLGGCTDRVALALSSFGSNKLAKASPVSVISMGRDDDDGLAKKWHIGGAD